VHQQSAKQAADKPAKKGRSSASSTPARQPAKASPAAKSAELRTPPAPQPGAQAVLANAGRAPSSAARGSPGACALDTVNAQPKKVHVYCAFLTFFKCRHHWSHCPQPPGPAATPGLTVPMGRCRRRRGCDSGPARHGALCGTRCGALPLPGARQAAGRGGGAPWAAPLQPPHPVAAPQLVQGAEGGHQGLKIVIGCIE
jgi:hypothetical protein